MITAKRIGILLLVFSSFIYPQVEGQFKYISPLPNSYFVSKKTNIILRYGEKIDAQSLSNQTDIKITGEKSGSHNSNLKLSDDNETLLLKIPTPFLEGESVNVHFNSKVKTISGQNVPELNFSFTISPLVQESLHPVINNDGEILFDSNNLSKKNHSIIKTDSIPSDFPKIKVRNLDNPTDGYTFITTNGYTPGVGYYLMMIKNDGTPYWYKKFDSNYPSDFKMQSNGMLSYAEIKEFYQFAGGGETVHRSEERRVGKECRSRWSPYH